MTKTKQKQKLINYKYYSKLFIQDISNYLTNNKREIESKQKTNKTYQNALNILVEYLTKYKIDITKIDGYDVKKLFNNIQATGYNRNGKHKIYSKSTMNIIKIVANKFFEWLKAEKVISRKLNNPFTVKLQSIKQNYNNTITHIHNKILDNSEIKRICDYITGDNNRIRDKQKLYNAVLIMLCFGLRVSELEKLDISDFTITDNNNIKLQVKPSKKGKARDTYFIGSDKQKKEILNYIDNQCNYNYNQKTIKKQIERISKALNISALSPHSFRHTYATIGINNGISLYTMSVLLGHNDTKTTQIYAKMLNKGIENELNGLKAL